MDRGGEIFTSTDGLSESVDESLRQAVQYDASDLPTGLYPYRLRVSSYYRSTVASNFLNGNILVNNQKESVFGAGWQVDGLERLHLRSDGNVVLTEGNGTVKFFSGVQRTALRFDGSNDVLTLGGLPALTRNTFEVWVKPNSGTEGTILAQGGGSGEACTSGIILRGRSSRLCYIISPDGCGADPTICSSGNWVGEWVHVAGTFDGSKQKLYINGE